MLTPLLISIPSGAQVLRLAGNAWPPYTDQRLPAGGLSVELISTALGRAGYQVSYVEVPWARAVLGLKLGHYDMINGWPNAHHAAYARYTRPFLSNRMRWVQRRDSGIVYRGLESLAPYRIALIRGYAYSEALQNDARLNKGYASNFVQAARMLVAGRIDLTREDERTAQFHFARELKDRHDAYRFVPGEFSLSNLSLVVRNDHPQQAAIIAAFDREIAAMFKDGTYAEIFRRHGLPAPESLPQP
nr:transporter substrate-binding domain-containing protein [Stutzerimonas stutzeri]